MFACSSNRLHLDDETTCYRPGRVDQRVDHRRVSGRAGQRLMMASTFGSLAACSMKRCKLVENEWYGWCTSTFPRAAWRNTLRQPSSPTRRAGGRARSPGNVDALPGQNGLSLSSGRSIRRGAETTRSGRARTATRSTSPGSMSSSGRGNPGRGRHRRGDLGRTGGPNRRPRECTFERCRGHRRASRRPRCRRGVTRKKSGCSTMRHTRDSQPRCAAIRFRVQINASVSGGRRRRGQARHVLGTLTRAKKNRGRRRDRAQRERSGESGDCKGNGRRVARSEPASGDREHLAAEVVEHPSRSPASRVAHARSRRPARPARPDSLVEASALAGLTRAEPQLGIIDKWFNGSNAVRARSGRRSAARLSSAKRTM